MNPLILGGALLAGLWWLILTRFPAPTWLWRQSLGHLLEMLLYGDHPRVLLQVLRDVIKTSLKWLQALTPASLLSLLVAIPITLIIYSYCNWRPPLVGESLLISLAGQPGAKLQLDDGLQLDSQPLWVANTSTTYWRLTARSPGTHHISSTSHARAQISVGDTWVFLRPQQTSFNLYYPKRVFWFNDMPISWYLLWGLSCLAWLILGLLIKYFYAWLPRQDGKMLPRS